MGRMKSAVAMKSAIAKAKKGINASELVAEEFKDMAFGPSNWDYTKQTLLTACRCPTEPDFMRSRILDDKGNVLLEEENIESRYKRWQKQRAEHRTNQKRFDLKKKTRSNS